MTVTGIRPLPHTDLFDPDSWLGLLDGGPALTLLMPTLRSGPETTRGPVMLTQLVQASQQVLTDQGHHPSVVQGLTDPLQALVGDELFWQQQSDGLACLSTGTGSSVVRIPMSLPLEVSAATTGRLRPLLPAFQHAEEAHLLALSQRSARLFRFNTVGIHEVDVPGMPAGPDDLAGDRDHQRHLQWSTQGGGDVRYHGHGGGSSVQRTRQDRFFRAVVDAVESTLGPAAGPVVLASVGEHVGAVRRLTRLDVLPDPVSGNPETMPLHDLHARASALMSQHRHREETSALRADLARQGDGTAVTDLPLLLQAAADARVERLWVRPDTPRPDLLRVAFDPVDTVVRDTLATGGDVRALPDDPADSDSHLGPDDELLGVLRWR